MRLNKKTSACLWNLLLNVEFSSSSSSNAKVTSSLMCCMLFWLFTFIVEVSVLLSSVCSKKGKLILIVMQKCMLRILIANIVAMLLKFKTVECEKECCFVSWTLQKKISNIKKCYIRGSLVSYSSDHVILVIGSKTLCSVFYMSNRVRSLYIFTDNPVKWCKCKTLHWLSFWLFFIW